MWDRSPGLSLASGRARGVLVQRDRGAFDLLDQHSRWLIAIAAIRAFVPSRGPSSPAAYPSGQLMIIALLGC